MTVRSWDRPDRTSDGPTGIRTAVPPSGRKPEKGRHGVAKVSDHRGFLSQGSGGFWTLQQECTRGPRVPEGMFRVESASPMTRAPS